MEGEDFVTSTLLPEVDIHRCGVFQELMALVLLLHKSGDDDAAIDGFAAKTETAGNADEEWPG